MESWPLVHKRRLRKNQRAVQVELLEGTNLECNIMHSPVDEVDLGFLPPYLDESRKHLTGVRLQCKHTFAVSALVYHWARNKTVQCPICRSGPSSASLKLAALPFEFRDRIRKKIRREWEIDSLEAESSNFEVAMRLQLSSTAQVTFESYQHRAMVFHIEPTDYMFSETQLGFLRNFLQTVHLYRIRVKYNDVEFPVTPWVRFDQEWVWLGPVLYLIRTREGHVSSVFISVLHA